eukprot:SAG22_NODE_1265_length_4958_cov_61.157440_3_plen_367_part_00
MITEACRNVCRDDELAIPALNLLHPPPASRGCSAGPGAPILAFGAAAMEACHRADLSRHQPAPAGPPAWRGRLRQLRAALRQPGPADSSSAAAAGPGPADLSDPWRAAAQHDDSEPTSVIFENPLRQPRAAGQVSLEEARFFKANGFLVRKNLLDPQLVEQARRRVYAAAPGPIDRADPASWVDAPRRWPPVADTTPRSPPGTDYRDYKGAKGVRLPSSYSTAGNVWKWHAEGDADWMKRLLPENPSVRQVAEQLLAGPVKPSVRARGVYTIFPAADPDATEAGAGGASGSTPPSSRPFTPARLGGHTDTMAHPLCFMAYLEPAAPRCGGFTLWPGNLKGLLLSRFIGLSALHLPYMCRRNDTPLD